MHLIHKVTGSFGAGFICSHPIALAIDGILDVEPVLCFSEVFHFKPWHLVDFEVLTLGNFPFSTEAE